MNGRNGDDDETDFEESEEEEVSEDLSSDDDDEVADIGTETMVGSTAEFKVDEIVAKIDKAADPDEAAHKREVRKRLEEIEEERDEAADSTFNFNLDDEL